MCLYKKKLNKLVTEENVRKPLIDQELDIIH